MNKVISVKSENWFLKLLKNVDKFLAIPLIGGIVIYQKLFSFDHSFWARPDLVRFCVHYPSCSAYSVQALKKYGFLKGTVMGISRILRCHPFTKKRYDPVE